MPTLEVSGADPAKKRPITTTAPEESLAVIDQPNHSGPNDLDRHAWRRAAAEMISQLAASGVVFTSDDIIGEIGRPPLKNQVSAAFSTAHRLGRVTIHGATVGDRGRAIKTWIGGAS